MADPRVLAVGNVLAVLKGRSLDRVLAAPAVLEDERDRALAAELSFGVCRWYGRLDALVGPLLQRPLKSRDLDLHVLLLVGAYQLLYSRIPPHAAVSSTVEASRRLGKAWASKLVNGVMRRLQREQQALSERVDADPAARHAQPDWLYRKIVAAWPQQHEQILSALQGRAPMVLRLDLQRRSRADYIGELAAAGFTARPHDEVATAVVLDQPADVHALPGFASGLVSVQDAGAQLAGQYLDLRPGQRVLDACAAPGGKTLDLLQRVSGLSLTAVDVDGERMQSVVENLARGGVQASLVIDDMSRPAVGDWAASPFDRILVDAPCSATGVLRRHPDIRLLRRKRDIPGLRARQAAILQSCWSLLAPGGRLLYVTCSLLPEENTGQVAAFAAATADAQVIELPTRPGLASGGGVQLLPGVDDSDGFFYAALIKRQA